MSKAQLSPDAQSALDVCKCLLASILIGGEEGRKQFESTLHPSGHMAHARYSRGKPVFFHSLIPELTDYVNDAWTNPGKHNEVIDGEATVLVDHDIAMVWTPYWFRVDGKLSHVGTNCFNLLKIYERVGEKGGEGSWEWKIVSACDTGRLPTEEDRRRLDAEYKSKRGDGEGSQE